MNATLRCKKSGWTMTGASYRDGAGCPAHSNLQRNGGNKSASDLYNHYAGGGPGGQSAAQMARDRPNGRYCCSYCHFFHADNMEKLR